MTVSAAERALVPQSPFWTDAEKAILREVYRSHTGNWREAAREAARRLPGRNSEACRHKAQVLGLCEPVRRYEGRQPPTAVTYQQETPVLDALPRRCPACGNAWYMVGAVLDTVAYACFGCCREVYVRRELTNAGRG